MGIAPEINVNAGSCASAISFLIFLLNDVFMAKLYAYDILEIMFFTFSYSPLVFSSFSFSPLLSLRPTFSNTFTFILSRLKGIGVLLSNMLIVLSFNSTG